MALPQPDLDVIETGLEPRFFINTFVRAELMPDGMVLLTYGMKHGTKVNVEYHVLLTTTALAEMSRQCQHIAADAHNMLMFKDDIGRAN